MGVVITSSLVILENLIYLVVILMYNAEDLKLKAEKFQEMKKDLSSTEQLDSFLNYVVKSERIIFNFKSFKLSLIL